MASSTLDCGIFGDFEGSYNLEGCVIYTTSDTTPHYVFAEKHGPKWYVLLICHFNIIASFLYIMYITFSIVLGVGLKILVNDNKTD